MKRKTTKQSPSMAARKNAAKDLEVEPAKSGTVRGGITACIPAPANSSHG